MVTSKRAYPKGRLPGPAACAPIPVGSHGQPTPPQKTLQHQEVGLVQSPVESLLLFPGFWCTQDFVCALQEWSLCFPLWKSCSLSHWPSKSDSLGIPSSFAKISRLGSLMWVSEPSQQWKNFFGIIILQFVSCPSGGYGIWSYCGRAPPSISLWLLSCLWVFFFFFLVSFSVLLLMVVQQLVAISVLSQEEMITCPLHHEHMSFYSRLAILSQSWKIYFKWELLSLFCFFSSSMSSSFSLFLLIFAFISGPPGLKIELWQ